MTDASDPMPSAGTTETVSFGGAGAGPPQHFSGIAVSPGIAIGPIVYRTTRSTCDGGRGTSDRAVGPIDPAVETEAFRSACRAAAAALRELIKTCNPMAAEILGFQEALLEDEDLLRRVETRIADGDKAAPAWRGVLDLEICDYRSDRAGALAARTGDLEDVRDRVLGHLLGAAEPGQPVSTGETGILLADDLLPSAFAALDWSRLSGVALQYGSATSHVALMARSRGIPMVAGIGELSDSAPLARTAVLDGERGNLVVDPDDETLTSARMMKHQDEANRRLLAKAAQAPAVTRSGRAVAVLINLDDPAALDDLDPAMCDGIGLVRTELFFDFDMPDEDAQFAAYASILRWADGRSVTFRTTDVGGDKPGRDEPFDPNPFMGVRGVRRSLRDPDGFRRQLRALARAAALGPARVMLPMVTNAAEVVAARAALECALEDLADAGRPHAAPPLGIMVETPAAALALADFLDGPAGVSFVSIGSNDLVQFVCAAARDNPDVAELADPDHPAVRRLIGDVVAVARQRGVEVSLCGDQASRPAAIRALLGLGLDRLSVAPAQVGAVKRAIAAAP